MNRLTNNDRCRVLACLVEGNSIRATVRITGICKRTVSRFLKDTDIPALIALDRLCPVLVRCGGCRFTCAAQDLTHLKACISAGGDYIRDVSLPVGALEAAANWQPEMLPASVQRAVTARAIIPHPATRRIVVSNGTMFNEADCGGVFDGFGVTSDADPGL